MFVKIDFTGKKFAQFPHHCSLNSHVTYSKLSTHHDFWCKKTPHSVGLSPPFVLLKFIKIPHFFCVSKFHVSRHPHPNIMLAKSMCCTGSHFCGISHHFLVNKPQKTDPMSTPRPCHPKIFIHAVFSGRDLPQPRRWLIEKGETV